MGQVIAIARPAELPVSRSKLSLSAGIHDWLWQVTSSLQGGLHDNVQPQDVRRLLITSCATCDRPHLPHLFVGCNLLLESVNIVDDSGPANEPRHLVRLRDDIQKGTPFRRIAPGTTSVSETATTMHILGSWAASCAHTTGAHSCAHASTIATAPPLNSSAPPRALRPRCTM